MHSDPDGTSDASSSGAAPWFAARLSDGWTAQSTAVRVRLAVAGLEIERPGQALRVIWPYAGLAAGTPIPRRAADALLTCAAMPGATLFVADPSFVRAVVAASPRLSAASFEWRAARPWLVTAAVLVCAGVATWLLDLSPTRAIADLLPDRVRVSIGRQVLAGMVGEHRHCEAPAGRAALDRLVGRLTAASGTSSVFRVTVADWGLLNAFAVPGEQIVLTRKIIDTAQSPDEVAGVLAHEMGHGLARHPESLIVRVVGLVAAMELMVGGSGGAVGNIGVMLTQLGYTRIAEREADARGLALLEQAQISSAGLVAFFNRIDKLEKTRGEVDWDILRSHPQSLERARLAADRPTYPATPALSPSDWQALREICGAKQQGPDPAEPPADPPVPGQKL